MGLLDLLVAASMPVIQILLITALGLALALDRFAILGEDARKHLNNIVFYICNPSLISSNLSKTITYESMKRLWFMPLNIFITFIVGSILAWVVNQITKPPKHLRGLVIGCCAAGNMGNMLLIIIPAVCKEKGSPFGAPDICHTYGMGYASLSMAVCAVFLWSYVYNIVRISSSKSPEEVEEVNDSSISKSARESSIAELGVSTEPLLQTNDLALSEHQSEQLALPSTRFDDKSQVSVWTRSRQYMGVLSKKMNLKKLLAPSTCGAVFSHCYPICVLNSFVLRDCVSSYLELIAGFVVGLIPQIRNAVIGDAAPLHVIQDTALILGDGAVPLLTLIMGGNLLKGLRVSVVPKSIIAGIIVVKYIAMPVIGIGVVKGASWLGLVHDDPLYKFVLLLHFALPPAMNIATITQLFGAGESECSVIMLWTYALASAALTLWTAFFMWLVS
ncbi:hypothetical protein MTR67_050307 [Solanum verrucosum]|uniref:Auxin efflux carrier family protein n=1 Tax=Solanum verrucosum TaxID=315347 RepID=A0AAF0V2P9_SOLVR|nr:hypothetical protein MTR67_050307 [Solanum verrucosum]